MVDMHYITLIRVRDTLGLSALEAAHYFGKTDTETWLKWESNQASVPQGVKEQVDAAMSRFQSLCEVVANAVRSGMTIKSVYREIAEAINCRAEYQVLEHKIAQSALDSIIVLIGSPLKQ